MTMLKRKIVEYALSALLLGRFICYNIRMQIRRLLVHAHFFYAPLASEIAACIRNFVDVCGAAQGYVVAEGVLPPGVARLGYRLFAAAGRLVRLLNGKGKNPKQAPRSVRNRAADRCILVSVVRDFALYRSCLAENPCLSDCEKVAYDNREENMPIPVRYNRFLDSLSSQTPPAWLVFCHEDFEPQEPLSPLLGTLDPDCLWGPVGAYRQSFGGLGRQRIVGSLAAAQKKVPRGFTVDTFDCCCLIVHTSLIEKFHLRFDEELAFDLYVEDFCASAKTRYGIPSKILPFKAVHHSDSKPTGRLYRHLPYLQAKYPHNLFTATCTYFGTQPPLMRLQRKLLSFFIKL